MKQLTEEQIIKSAIASTLAAEEKALGAFLAAMHDCKLDGKKMREAMIRVLGLTGEAQPAAKQCEYTGGECKRVCIGQCQAMQLAQLKPLGLEESLGQTSVCCGEYASCHRLCTPRGRWEAANTDRDNEWVIAMVEALGSSRGYTVPIVPNPDAFRALFADIVKCAKPPATNTGLLDAAKKALAALEKSRGCLEQENLTQGGSICDTIWYDKYETLFDYMASEIEQLRAAIAKESGK